jgi:hypothetical protein
MKLFNIICFSIFLTTFFGCNGDADSSPNNTQVRYEIVSTTSFKVPTLNGTALSPYSLNISYLNESGGQQNEQIIANGTTYTKTVTMQTELRPLPIQYAVSGYTLNTTGTVTTKIYVNNSLKGTKTVDISDFSGNGMFSSYLTIILE